MSETTGQKSGCWVLVNPAGEFYDSGHSIPHWPTQDNAASDAVEADVPEGYVTHQLDKACVTLPCACCGGSLETDDGVTEHSESVEAARATAKDCGWSTREDGADVCEDCRGHVRGCLPLPPASVAPAAQTSPTTTP